MAWTSPYRLDKSEHDLVTAAVSEAERETDAEIVTIVADLSDHYDDVPLFWAGGMTLLVLSVLAAFPALCHKLFDLIVQGWITEMSERNLLLTVFIVALVTFLLVWMILQWMPLRLRLAPHDMKTRRCHKRAVDLFRVAAEGRTMGRTGILIYLSLGEHRAEIVADAAIAGKVAPEAWGDMMAEMVAHVRKGQVGHGMAMAVRQAGDVLAVHVPKTEGNPNELPDRVIEI
ncbi:TPM domain-containing protein [Govanella unica]|uniref:TPM domain-containing protein n=1 Tax=Govanella unica TaxID=2975056 RepID=A0A9X3TX68_9PROT|nr:hypothetical protein [Govania unica]MDA5193298.1 hypothetical protein [Govania unica]